MERKRRAVVTEPLGALLANVPKSKPGWLTVVKTTVAATLAWVLARQLGENVAVLFAPVVAVLTLQASVYGSLATGVQLLFANLVGTALAIAWVQLLGLTWWTLAAAAFVALAVARQVTNTPLARNQLTFATLAVLVLTPMAQGYGQWRFIDVALGSVVGLVVAVVIPERPRLGLIRTALDAWGAACVRVLRDIADELGERAGEPLELDSRHDFIAKSRALGDLGAEATASLAGVEETTVLNIAAGRLRRDLDEARGEHLWLVRITTQVRAVSLAVDRLYDRPGHPPALDRDTLRALLGATADLLGARLAGESPDDASLREALSAAVLRVHTVFPTALAVLDSVTLLGRLDQLRQDAAEDPEALVDLDELPRTDQR
ncbi:aromatic acid exporter family protein [Dactylosporangium sp. AC04546]|uniref:FUSC family protein n=1 Tax=Dactylosporangium sp. AC04546 TaxID=2862460 RepID=UPI001EDCC34D|nr:aromatic acid exporter family protein [Dactylosporangium sp. AC04546]WVK79745.1 aromatic acid exporter family protein [Dactylosporangium sp. AC04546]